jgi:hypothetical protein
MHNGFGALFCSKCSAAVRTAGSGTFTSITRVPMIQNDRSCEGSFKRSQRRNHFESKACVHLLWPYPQSGPIPIWYSIDWKFNTDEQNQTPLQIFDFRCPVTDQQPKTVLPISVTT